MSRIILSGKQAVMKVPNNISIHIEGGYLQISGQIPVVDASMEIEPFIRELKFQLFGDSQTVNGRPASIVPKDLDEKDAAKYIGRSVSFLRGCRYGGKNKGGDRGPKYTRVSQRCIRYPVHELDKWLEKCRLYGACCEEEVQPAKGRQENPRCRRPRRGEAECPT
ncbi:MAG: hypothetical protein LBL73_08770 [Synergistaceae bacterium]|jgi:hypothetical protein|nr:hypothetical protein [Synergistaceae bacterium]